ncbi:UTRA domain-containing protein [Nonomuraea sp. NPDC050536]|uniref:UTRA domain-containing protein n=1 Tax=Nonomuraea sp. NPDC050536 TaxID=3364366 RepID=UPI0037CAF455
MAAQVGRSLSVAEGYVQARHPTDTEAKLLGIAQASCVLVRATLTCDEQGEPVAYSICVWPGDSTRLSLP